MITQYRPSYYQSPRVSSFAGLSVDDKPLDVENGSSFNEIDTGRIFRYDKENNLWIEQKSATGATGESGATFTPSVSEAGVISWTNDKGLANPSPVNIKGATGATGATGAAGQSAYAAAQSGGYTDTEANFYADLAAIQGLADALAAI